jgi:hypothetical protein
MLPESEGVVKEAEGMEGAGARADRNRRGAEARRTSFGAAEVMVFVDPRGSADFVSDL